MILVRSIQLHNFKQYRRAEIKPDAKSGLFFFIGQNKLGKSNFLNAICWCLYEEQPFKETIDQQRGGAAGLLNEDAKRENEYDEVRVEIEIQYDAEVFRFSRSQRTTQSSIFTVFRKTGSDWRPIDNPNTIVESFLPRNLRQYFIFAGENVQGLFSKGHETGLKKGIWQVANIEELDRGINHLESIYSELRKSAAKGDNTLEGLDEKISASKNEVEANKKTIERNEAEIEKLSDIKKEREEKQRTYQQYSELIKRRADLNAEIASIEEDTEKNKGRINELLLRKSPFLYVESQLKKVAERLKQEKELGTLPPRIKAEFIDELLEHHVCICGRSLSTQDKEACSHLASLKEEMQEIDQRTPILEDQTAIKQIIDQIGEFGTELDFLKQKQIKNLDAMERANRTLRDISVQLENAPNVEVGSLEGEIRAITGDIDEFKEGSIRLKVQNETLAASIAEFEKAQKLGMEKKADALEKMAQMEVVEEAQKKLEFVRDRIVDRVRATLSSKTEKYFKQLFWEKGTFESIKFSEDYKLLAYKPGDEEPAKEFSTGELKTLGLAALKAIGELSGFRDVPIFFDAPLSNLDAQVRDNVLNMLPDLAPQKQVFIFSLDDEAIMKFIHDRYHGAFATLGRDPANSRSTIIKNI